MKPTDLPARLAVKIRIDEETSCWLWIAAHDPEGYGRVHWQSGKAAKKWHAHRLVWTLLTGPIPAGFVLDHLCGTPACVNPRHLEPVSPEENSSRVGGVPNRNGRCRTGQHAWIEANIYVGPNGHRTCRLCMWEVGQRRTASGKRRKARPGSGQAPLGF